MNEKIIEIKVKTAQYQLLRVILRDVIPDRDETYSPLTGGWNACRALMLENLDKVSSQLSTTPKMGNFECEDSACGYTWGPEDEGNLTSDMRDGWVCPKCSYEQKVRMKEQAKELADEAERWPTQESIN